MGPANPSNPADVPTSWFSQTQAQIRIQAVVVVVVGHLRDLHLLYIVLIPVIALLPCRHMVVVV